MCADPDVAGQSLRAAAVVAESTRIREMLSADPAAVAVDEERRGPAMLYACYARWHELDANREAPFGEVVRLLLDAGASPSTNNGARPHHGYRSASARLLLERGAHPDDGESLDQVAAHRDHTCLEVLLAHGATVAGTWAFEVAVHAGEAVTMLLGAAEQAPGQAAALPPGSCPTRPPTARERSSPPCSPPAPNPAPATATDYRRYAGRCARRQH